MKTLPTLAAALLALAGCDPVACPGDLLSTSGPADPTTEPTTGTGSGSGGGGEVDPKVCAPITTDPKVACGLVCVDEYGIDLTILCVAGGGWECGLYPRTGPVIGEVYSDLPVWCGGKGKNEK